VLHELYHPIITGVRRMPKPVLAAVNGPAVGIGCSLALACDIVLAAESAYFMLAFVNIGLVPDGGASVFVTARVGAGRAAEMALLGERVPAATGSAWGLVDRLVSDDSFAAEVDALAERLATGPTRAYAGAKAELNARAYASIDEQLALEASLQQQAAASPDFREGVLAFLEKRPARFSGE
jgi:2-(1,2-epoxy-1,2-dihydrophenyl)acetyl-CoA isomerase